jgi:radical SAM protein with 4Fe4S-binding SPASM domain
VLRDAGLDFSLHMSVTDWNVEEIPAMIDLAQELDARVLNFFFLVRTGRGANLTDIPAAQYETILTALARAQGVGSSERPPASAFTKQEDPWSLPVGVAGRLLIRAKCAPHFRRIIWELDPTSPLLQNYAHGSCPAGKYYCRITPEGDVTPCPYMPVTAGNLRQTSFAALWQHASVFDDLRDPHLGGRCGTCEFSKICGGCRCRAYATSGDYLAEDPACAYQPGQHGGTVIDLPASQTFGIEVTQELQWDEAARARLKAIPSFARGMVIKGVEAYARSQGYQVITPALLTEIRQTWGARFRPKR